MMKDHKVRQKIYHVNASITGHKDDLETIARTEKIEHRENFQEIVDCTIAHFRTEQPNLIYPCKSYFVALIYAKLLEKHFKEPLLDSLRDPDLLYGNDKYFLPYGIAYQVYDAVWLKWERCWIELPMTTSRAFLHRSKAQSDILKKNFRSRSREIQRILLLLQ